MNPARPARPQAGHGVPNEHRFGVSQVIVAGGLAYVAGQIAREGDGRPSATRDASAHAAKVLDNLALILDRVGLRPADVVWVESHETQELDGDRTTRPPWFDPAHTAGITIPIDGLYDPAYQLEVTTIAAQPHVPRRSLPGPPGAAFARAVRVGPHVFVSGQHGLTERSAVRPSVARQCALALDRFLECVRELGGQQDDVVSTHIYTARELTADELEGVANAHRVRFRGVNRPTSNLIGVRRLGSAGADVEICGVAIVDDAGEPQERSSS